MSDNSRNSDVLPVPQSMRTRRTAPRVFAVLITITWAVVYVMGTNVLANRDAASNALIDDFLLSGEHSWGVFHRSSSERCIGILDTALSIGENEFLNSNIEGRFFVNLFKKPIFISFAANFTFGAFNRLEEINGNLNAGKTNISVNSAGENGELILLNLQAGSIQQSRSFPKPEPVYLVKKSDTRFSLFLPPEIRTLAHNDRVAELAFSDMTGISARLLAANEVQDCRSESLVVDSSLNSQLFDLGSLFNLLGVSPNEATLKQLREAVTDD